MNKNILMNLQFVSSHFQAHQTIAKSFTHLSLLITPINHAHGHMILAEWAWAKIGQGRTPPLMTNKQSQSLVFHTFRASILHSVFPVSIFCQHSITQHFCQSRQQWNWEFGLYSGFHKRCSSQQWLNWFMDAPCQLYSYIYTPYYTRKHLTSEPRIDPGWGQ